MQLNNDLVGMKNLILQLERDNQHLSQDIT